MVGNVLLVAYYEIANDNLRKANNEKGLLITGLILQGLGYSFIYSASLSYLGHVLTHKDGPPNEREGKPIRALPERLLNVANIVALILLIVGYNGSMDAIVQGTKMSVLVATGNAIYLVLTFIVAILSLVTLFKVSILYHRRLLLTVVLASPFMFVRCAYILYVTTGNTLRYGSISERIVLQYVMEVISFCIFSIAGILIREDLVTKHLDLELT